MSNICNLIPSSSALARLLTFAGAVQGDDCVGDLVLGDYTFERKAVVGPDLHQ
jgi:hypothetical protein